MNGGDSMWGSICNEGASIGNASTCVSLMNMVRLGNKNILKKYKCNYLRTAAANVTKITTGENPHKKQVVYGERALDFVFGLKKVTTGLDMDMAEFFGEKAPIRITHLSKPPMIQAKLRDLFGENEQFTFEMGGKMMEKMWEDLRDGR